MLKFFLKNLFGILLALSLNQIVFAGVEFDEVDDSVTLGTNTYQSTNNFSISAWVKAEDHTDFGAVFSAAATRSFLGISSGDAWFWQIFDGAGRSVTGSANDNAWHHLVGTKSSSTGLRLYLDGTLDANNVNFTAAVVYVSGLTAIGETANDSTFQFGGIITDVAFWTVVITDAEITQLSQSRVKRMPLQIQPSNLTGYWPLDQGADGTANCFNGSASFLDLSSTGQAGTGDDGANNTGLTCKAEEVLSYA